jgi:predicted urease superfamily metal-dependent hydrolase
MPELSESCETCKKLVDELAAIGVIHRPPATGSRDSLKVNKDTMLYAMERSKQKMLVK